MMWAWRCRCLSLSYCILRAVMSVLILSMYTQSLLPGPSSDSTPYAPGPTTEMSIPGKTSSRVHFKGYYSSPFLLLLNKLSKIALKRSMKGIYAWCEKIPLIVLTKNTMCIHSCWIFQLYHTSTWNAQDLQIVLVCAWPGSSHSLQYMQQNNTGNLTIWWRCSSVVKHQARDRKA